MLRPVPFYYLRHGQTDWNLERRFQGQNDIPLNAYGEMQAQNAGHLLRDEPIACIIASPLKRAMRTAQIVNETLRCPLIAQDGLREIAFGEWEGTIMDPSAYAEWRAGRVAPMGAETLDAFHSRVLAAVNEALDRPGPVLIVGHGGVYWGVERHGGFTTHLSIPNAAPILHTPPAGDGGWSRRILGP
jgi:broad specificity phosphatase PhoE